MVSPPRCAAERASCCFEAADGGGVPRRPDFAAGRSSLYGLYWRALSGAPSTSSLPWSHRPAVPQSAPDPSLKQRMVAAFRVGQTLRQESSLYGLGTLAFRRRSRPTHAVPPGVRAAYAIAAIAHIGKACDAAEVSRLRATVPAHFLVWQAACQLCELRAARTCTTTPRIWQLLVVCSTAFSPTKYMLTTLQIYMQHMPIPTCKW